MSSWEEPYITFHIVWHPGCTESQGAASCLIQHFTRDRFAIEEMGVSVFEWSEPPPRAAVLPPFDFAMGETSAVVVLVSDEIEQDANWSNYVGRLIDRYTSGDDGSPIRRLFLIAMTEGRLATSSAVQALRWCDWPGDSSRRVRRLVREVTYETSRMLRDTLVGEPDLTRQMERIRVFLSHSKHDDDNIGERVAKCVRDWLQEDVTLSVFLDIVDVPAGLPSDEVLDAAVRQSAVLIVHSDSFSSREWCRREVLVAKASGRPIVILDSIEDLDERAFPYIANVPVVRLRSQQPNGIERVVGRLLDEVFKDFLWQCRTATLRRTYPNVMFVARPPELLTLVNVMKNSPNKSVLVYPDPPLGLRELSVLADIGPPVVSLSEWMEESV